jgi:mycothiol synthase
MLLRPPSPADAPAVLELIHDREAADFGHAALTLENLSGEWSLSEFDLTADAVLCVSEAGEVLAYAAVKRILAQAVVAPRHEGRGIGGLLLEWLLARERALGRAAHRQAIAATNVRGAQLLRGAGYEPFVSYSRMVRPLAEPVLPAPAPPGLALRLLDRRADARAVFEIDADAFAAAPDFVPMSFRAFCEENLDQSDHAPEFSLMAEVGGEPAGFLLGCWRSEQSAGYVSILAVAPTRHGQGIGRALLESSFARMAAEGLAEAQLSVASHNPAARRLYERAGMRERSRVDVLERPAG